MTKQFTIKKICEEENRPPYSKKVDEYFEAFVADNILNVYSNIVTGDWRIVLSIMIFRKEDDAPEGVSLYEPDDFEDDKLKVYPVGINVEDIYKNDEHMVNIVGIYFQIISLFFLTNYKIVSKEYLVELMDKIDWEYLLSLPYPAPAEEQGYVVNQ